MLHTHSISLRVTVTRHANFTLGYDVDLVSTLSFRPLDGVGGVLVSAPVIGWAQLRLREIHAYQYGWPVEPSAVLRSNRFVKDRGDLAALQQKEGFQQRHPPALVLARHGLGMATLDGMTLDVEPTDVGGAREPDLIELIYPSLQDGGSLPPRDDDGTFLPALTTEAKRALPRQLENLSRLRSNLSRMGMTALFSRRGCMDCRCC